MNSLLHKIGFFLKYVFMIVVLPISIINFIIQYKKFKKYVNVIKQAVNDNEDFYNYLNKFDFVPDWLGRLYSIQPIPKEFRDFTEDELYDITMRSLFPLMKLLEKSVLIDVCSVIISRNTEQLYTVTLTPYVWPQFRNALITLFFSVIVNIIGWSVYFIWL